LNIELQRVSYEFIGVEKVKGPRAGRKYVLGSGNGVRSRKQSLETSGDRVWSSEELGIPLQTI